MKQDVLPASLFVKNPSLKFVKKHEKLVQRVHPMKQSPKPYKMSAGLRKHLEKREKEAKDAEDGIFGWKKWLLTKQIYNENIDPAVMYQVHGPAPPLEAPNGETFTESELESCGSEEEDLAECLMEGFEMSSDGSPKEGDDQCSEGEKP